MLLEEWWVQSVQQRAVRVCVCGVGCVRVHARVRACLCTHHPRMPAHMVDMEWQLEVASEMLRTENIRWSVHLVQQVAMLFIVM